MNRNVKVSTVILILTAVILLTACVPDPYSQKNGSSTNTQQLQPYGQSYVPPPSGQLAYAQPQYFQPSWSQVPYDRISQSESASISRGTCDRNLLATVPDGAANPFIGTTTGPLVAGEIQSSMAPADNTCVSLTLEYARNNQPVAWQNPANGALFEIIPISTYQEPGGSPCREYTMVGTLNGLSRRINDTACRLPTGSWQLQS
jgi:surface antigen